METVEDIYNRLATAKAVEKLKQDKISSYVNGLYDACVQADPNAMKRYPLEKSAAAWANWTPGKCGIGQHAQIYFLLKYKFSTIQELKPRGKNSVKLWRDANGGLSIKKCQGNSNIAGVKSFDAIVEDDKTVDLFVLKTVDIGKFSESEGGGHQDNVRDELVNLISHVKGMQLTYQGKSVRNIYILVDGRSSAEIIEHCKVIAANSTGIIINNCESL